MGKFEKVLEENGKILKYVIPVIFQKILEKPKEIVCNFSTNFGSTAENITEILRKFLKFFNNFVELCRILMLGNIVT